MSIRRSLALLAVPAAAGIGWVKFPVYTFSGDLGPHGTTCAESSACARAWPPLYTDGSSGYSGVPAVGVSVVGLPVGPDQVTWNGRPLYLFSNEALAPTSNGGAVPVGNGNGIKAFGGTFSLVVNP
jgi:predicted lipoprotein with Yx(FWY)xxD motif